MGAFASFLNLTNGHPIIQGALGSGLFWVVLRVFQFLWPRFLRLIGYTVTIDRRKKFREYIYLRYTSMDGLVNSVEGHQLSTSRAFRGLLTGLMFICVALLIGGSTAVIWGICLVAALVYFWSALMWLIPDPSWKGLSALARWQRIAELEKDLLGEIDPSTSEALTRFRDAKAHEETDPATAE